MRRTIVIAIFALVAGCHRQPQDRVQPKAPQGQPIALDTSGPMKSGDIDEIAAEVRKRDARQPTRPPVAKPAGHEVHP